MADRVQSFLSWYNGPELSGRVERETFARRGSRAETDVRQFLAQCDRWDVDPKRLALARQEAVKWRVRVQIKHLCSTKPAFLAAFRDWGDRKEAEGQLQRRFRDAKTSDNPSPTGEPSPLAETIRRANQLDRETCMNHMGNPGYNPASVWCPTCPLATACWDLHWGTRAVD